MARHVDAEYRACVNRGPESHLLAERDERGGRFKAPRLAEDCDAEGKVLKEDLRYEAIKAEGIGGGA